MRFNLVDRIVAVQPGQSIRVFKQLTLGEEYLADHFPTFPVMPGVLMLQLLVEAGSWLIRYTDDFRHSVIVLRETKNVKYGTFMEPGKRLDVTVTLGKQDGDRVTLKGSGEVESVACVSAAITLARYNLADRNPVWQERDRKLVEHLRSQGDWLRQSGDMATRSVESGIAGDGTASK